MLRRCGPSLLCPDHQDAGHRPQPFIWEPGAKFLTTSCECGEVSGELRPTTLETCTTWWQQHVLDAAPARPAADDTTEHHVVEFREDGWTIMHPLACRPNLFDCAVNRAAEAQLTEAPDELGRFRCGLAEDGQLVVGEQAPVSPAADTTPIVDEATVEHATVAEALESATCTLAFSPRDWGLSSRDAWLYGLLCGWDCEKSHAHDDACADGDAMREMAEKHGWTSEHVDTLRRYRAAIGALMERTQR